MYFKWRVLRPLNFLFNVFISSPVSSMSTIKQFFSILLSNDVIFVNLTYVAKELLCIKYSSLVMIDEIIFQNAIMYASQVLVFCENEGSTILWNPRHYLPSSITSQKTALQCRSLFLILVLHGNLFLSQIRDFYI